MKNIPIFLSSDNNYAPFVATTIASVCDNTDFFAEIYVLDGGITEENKGKICKLKQRFNNFSIEFLYIDIEKEFTSIDYTNVEYITLSTYNRFLIPKLKPELEKVLYLDVDIVVVGDIVELFEHDLEDYALGACWNKTREFYNTDSKNCMEFSDAYKYFNAGVLLLDVQKWKQKNIVQKMFETEKKYRGKILHADETLLNKIFDSDYKIFDIKFNYLDYDVLNSPAHEVVIRHFATPMKPWKFNFAILNKQIVPLQNFEDFWKYARMTSFYEEIKNMYFNNINSSNFNKIMCNKIEREYNLHHIFDTLEKSGDYHG